MRQLFIVGAGEFGREVFDWVASSPNFRQYHEISRVRFLDDTLTNVIGRAEVAGPISRHMPQNDAYYLCAIGNPATRKSLVTQLEEDGATFISFIHDTVISGKGISLGTGSIICPGSILTSDISIGRHVHVNLSCTIGHDVVIGNFVTISPACNLNGWVTLEPGVFLGTGVTIIPRKTIGSNSRVGAGSVVIRSIKSDLTAFGNPCTIMRPAHGK